MAKQTAIISDFTRGELSPRMEGRTDEEAFFQGVSKLENMLVLPQGGVEKRPGTVYLTPAQNADKPSRLIPFVLSSREKYLLELYDGGCNVLDLQQSPATKITDQYVLTLDTAPSSDFAVGTRIEGQTSEEVCWVLQINSSTEYVVTNPTGAFTDGEIMEGQDATGATVTADQGLGFPSVALVATGVSGNTDPVYSKSTETWYTEDQLFDVKYVQTGRQLVLVHPEHPPKILTFLTPTGFLWSVIEFDIPEFEPSGTTTETVIEYQDVGRRRTIVDQVPVEVTVTVRLPSEYLIGEVVKDGSDYFRCLVNRPKTAATSETSNWEPLTVTAVNPFSAPGRYPQTVAFYQNRLIFGGSTLAPNTIYMSATGAFGNLLAGANPSDPIVFSFLSERSDEIQWIAAKDVLVAGTLGSEWVIQGQGGVVTPTTVGSNRQTTFGSSSVQAKLINQSVLFVQKGGRKIREYFFRDEIRSYQAQDLTFYSDHITESGVREMGFQSDPDPILWVLLNNGTLLSLTYDTARGIQGWARHQTEGEIESFGITPNGGEDRVWVIVKREINGATVRYIEYFASRQEQLQRDGVFVDSALTLDGGPTFSITSATAADPVSVTATAHGLSTGDKVRLTDVEGMTELEGRTFIITVTGVDTFTLDNEDGTGRTAATGGTAEQVFSQVTGLDHLEGEVVNICADGYPHAQRTVSSGAVTLDQGTFSNTIHVGLPYSSLLRTMNIAAPVVQSKRSRIHKARVRFIETVQSEVGSSEDALNEVVFRAPSTPYGEGAMLFTGEKEIPVDAAYGQDQRIVIKSDRPVAQTVAVILPEIGLYQGAS